MVQAEAKLQGLKDQPLWIFGGSGPLSPKLAHWLSAFSWQQTHDLAHIKKALLSTIHSVVLVDMTHSPHRMLAQIRFLQEHFTNSVIVSIVDIEDPHWGQEALRQGADAYVSPDAVSSAGLNMLLESLQKQKLKQSLLSSALDPCTGLINEPLFFDRLSHALQVGVRHQCQTGILLVSINRFSHWIHHYGEVLCDGLLNHVAKQLQSHIRNSDSLCRIQEGTFAILLEDLQDEVMVGHIAKHIEQSFSNPIEFQDNTYSLTVSIGGHLCQSGETNSEALYRQAEIALERAEASGKNSIWFYAPDMNLKAMARLNMQQGLQRALERNEFSLVYQPCHLANGFKSYGVVSEIRWHHPTAGTVLPDVFMSLLRDSGLILPVGRWQIKTMLKQIKAWQNSGDWKLSQRLYLPICEKQLREMDFSDFFLNELYEVDISADQILLTIDEKTIIRNGTLISNIKKRVPNLGLCVKLEDFGKQYHSLSYLKQYDVDCLCLDQSFFLHMHMDHLETSITKVIVDVAHRLGVEVMAMGADTQYKVDKMQALGCDVLIGEYFASPMNVDKWSKYQKEHC
jgi:diguanylate cyclase (GGDEF)-like protein